MARLKIVFAGTPGFAASSLSSLLARSEVDVVAVYTQPDRRAGRGQQIRQSPVKLLALSRDLPVLQPPSLRDPSAIEALADFGCDLLVVAAYGQILPQAVLDLPNLDAINVHASLLPRWRGAAPIQRALMAGDTETGITIMRMVARLDAGPMLLQRRCDILPEDTGGTLHDRLATLGGVALNAAIELYLEGNPVSTPQVEEAVTYAQKIERADREIDWSGQALALDRQVRALHPSPLATTSLGGIGVSLVAAEAVPGKTVDGPPGQITLATDHLDVATGEGTLRIRSLQPAGKSVMSAREFINGYRQRLQH